MKRFPLATWSQSSWCDPRLKRKLLYHCPVDEKKLFWLIFIILSLVADFLLPLLWGLVASIPILFFSWWLVYRSGWI